MANQLRLDATFSFIADGVSNTLVVDLLENAYETGPGVRNWPPSDRKAPLPTSAAFDTGTATISGQVLTLTFNNVPAQGPASVGVKLIF